LHLQITNSIHVLVDELFVYPIKACAPVRVDALAFDEGGWLKGDREWVVVDAQSQVVWQGSHPRLALVHPEFHGGRLALRNTAGECVELGQPATWIRREVAIWNDTTKQHDTFGAHDAGDPAAAFLACTVGASLRLVRLGPEGRLRDGVNRVHVVSRASFEELAADLPDVGHSPEAIQRCRPNVVIKAGHEPLIPFIEEQFTELKWQEDGATARLAVRERCVRCVVPNVDPATGLEDARVLAVISQHSATRYPGQPTYFGLYATTSRASTLTRGTVLEASVAF
jgi:uncharacterized protein